VRVALVLAAIAALLASAAEARLAPSLDARVVAAPVPERKAATHVWPPGRERPLLVVRGGGPRTGNGPEMRYLVEVEAGIVIARLEFARLVHSILGHPRSWRGTGRVSFRRVSRGPVDFRVTLASPATTDRLCAPNLTNGIYSCANGGRAVLNLVRWRQGASAYSDVQRYRRYLVNHEVGHLLGHGHVSCPGAGSPAPVMMQQTKGVAPCLANPWPLSWERG
jgi:Protein of unknown function (DUF3152)